MAFPHNGNVRGEFMIRTIALLTMEDTRVGEVYDLQTGPGIGMARNKLVTRFMDSGRDWLWFCDSDMVVSTETLPALLKYADPEEHPVVGTLCCVLTDQDVRVSMYQSSRDDEGKFAFRHIVKWPEDTLLRVDATGAGCLLIHRSVFEKISTQKPEEDGLWFAEMIIDTHQIGEDLSFCMRCAMAEIPVYVHTGIQVGHMKSVQMGVIEP